jgi:hypothetical protein
MSSVNSKSNKSAKRSTMPEISLEYINKFALIGQKLALHEVNNQSTTVIFTLEVEKENIIAELPSKDLLGKFQQKLEVLKHVISSFLKFL